ncbi:hypothetical protein DWB68_11490 [Galactobacter valiniphilus]|uniref:Uncharacterized protein n=1 Tax=Galactobacter valiniphilus TaxID=2676122 RepID=A0A399J820_9MICC|nr:hypothetical protein DWB68_11490 [Galactobacter valiniphilus]
MRLVVLTLICWGLTATVGVPLIQKATAGYSSAEVTVTKQTSDTVQRSRRSTQVVHRGERQIVRLESQRRIGRGMAAPHGLRAGGVGLHRGTRRRGERQKASAASDSVSHPVLTHTQHDAAWSP